MTGAVRNYFQNITEAAKTIFDGMAVTASHLVREPATVQYPDRTKIPVRDMLPFRYRGILDVDIAICTGCQACERACPIDCIAIETVRDKETKTLVIHRFDIDVLKCMYCGLCGEPCPTGAIHHTPEFEGADFAPSDIIRHFVREPVVAYKAKKTGEDDPELKVLVERGKLYKSEFAVPPAPPKKPAAKPAAPKPTSEKGEKA